MDGVRSGAPWSDIARGRADGTHRLIALLPSVTLRNREGRPDLKFNSWDNLVRLGMVTKRERARTRELWGDKGSGGKAGKERSLQLTCDIYIEEVG